MVDQMMTVPSFHDALCKDVAFGFMIVAFLVCRFEALEFPEINHIFESIMDDMIALLAALKGQHEDAFYFWMSTCPC